MAKEQAMISPFVANQVKQNNGEKLISYGVNSYGYDVRCAPEFKIFTNTILLWIPKIFQAKFL